MCYFLTRWLRSFEVSRINSNQRKVVYIKFFDKIGRYLRNSKHSSPYYNRLQWYFRGLSYGSREISNCYLNLYDELCQLALVCKPSSVLEYGCGDAFFLRKLGALDPDVRLCGCDFSSSQLRFAKRLIPNGDLRLQDITETSYRDKEFDVVVGVSVLMYLNPLQLKMALRELGRIGGRVIIAEMSSANLCGDELESFFLAGDGRFDHDYFFELKNAGFTDIRFHRCGCFLDASTNTSGEMGYGIFSAKS